MVSAAGMGRRAAVAALLRGRGAGCPVVCGLGSPSYDVHAAGDRDDNFYLWGAMGAAALVGLGLARAQPDRPVLVVTGDGEQLMAFGSLATIAVARPRNLAIAVVDNGHYGETGMQASHTGRGIDLARVAASCGFSEARRLHDLAEVEALGAGLFRLAEGPRFYALQVAADSPKRSLPVRDAVYLKNRFRARLGFPLQ